MKRGASDAFGGKGSGRRRGEPHHGSKDFPGDPGVPRGSACVFKALCTEDLTGLLLGGRAALKDAIQQETGAKLVFSNKGDFFPATNYRVLGVYADTQDRVVFALDKVLIRICELGDQDKANKNDNSELLGKEPGEYIFRFCVSKQMAGLLIGTKGATVQRLRQETGAKVFIENETVMGHRLVRIIGKPESVIGCVAKVMEVMMEDANSEEFQMYLRLINFGAAAASGWDFEQAVGGGGVGGGVGALVPVSGGGGGGGPEPRRPRTSGPAVSPVVDMKMPPLEQHIGVGLDRLEEDILAFPPGTADALYCISCLVPATRAKSLIGRAGEFVKSVEEASFAKVELDNHVEDDSRVLSCTGTLVQVYTAHAMMIQRLQEMAAKEEAMRRAEASSPAPPAQSPQELMATIANLQRQLQEAKKRGG